MPKATRCSDDAFRMKLAIALVALLAAAPAVALNIVLKDRPAPVEEEALAKAAPASNLRPTQVIRCADAKGNLVLQDIPRKPVEAGAASAVAEVTDLSALVPRPAAASAARPAPQEPEMGIYAKGFLNGAWKLGLLSMVGYGLWRIARATRDHYREKYARVETRRHRPRRVM